MATGTTVMLVVAAGAAVAGFVQGLSGFAFGLVALSFWAWVLDPRLAAVLVVFGSLCGQLLTAANVRRGFDAKLLAPFVAGGLAGIPIGMALLPRLDVSAFKLALGALLVLWCPVMLVARELPRLRAGGLADALSGLCGGIMGGAGGLSGPVPTLWCSLKQLDKDRQRSVIQGFNLVMQAVTMGGYLAAGTVRRDMLPMLGVVALAMLLPSLLGARVYMGISELAFRRVVLSALTLSGLVLLVSGLRG